MEPVTKSAGTLRVAIFGQVVWIKISGKANFASSLDLKNLVTELWGRDYCRFVFELSDCVIMDSTFLGGLAGIGLRFNESNQNGRGCSVELANPNSRISDTLENLGVAHLFNIIQTAHPESEEFTPVARDGEETSRVEVARNCLEAHKILMDLKPANVGKFKDVAQFLAEDLKKLEQVKRD